jgi:hypothetical protein
MSGQETGVRSALRAKILTRGPDVVGEARSGSASREARVKI